MWNGKNRAVNTGKRIVETRDYISDLTEECQKQKLEGDLGVVLRALAVSFTSVYNLQSRIK